MTPRCQLAGLILGPLTALTATPALADTWAVYDYTAQVSRDLSIGSASFAQGAAITGQVFVLLGTSPTNNGWGFAGEVALYVDTVHRFTFDTAGLSVTGTGAGNAEVDNNRRLTQRATAFQDVFGASLLPEATTQFSPTAIGGGVTGVAFELRSPFLGGFPSATTSVALPTTVDVNKFSGSNYLNLNFADGNTLQGTITSMNVSYVTQLPAAVPEPAAAVLASLGLVALGLLKRRRRNG